MVTGRDLRIGDADREAVAASLREHYAQGRLTLEEFNQRLGAALQATTQSQLSMLTRDLPHAGPSAPLPVTDAGREWAGHDYQSSGCGHRGRFGMFPVIIAAIIAWLVLFDLHLGAGFPWPGKLALLLAALTLLRGLLRRVFAASRSRGGGGYPRGRGGRYSGGSWPGGH
jgi:Domain of unknown function (DUF1707)